MQLSFTRQPAASLHPLDHEHTPGSTPFMRAERTPQTSNNDAGTRCDPSNTDEPQEAGPPRSRGPGALTLDKHWASVRCDHAVMPPTPRKSPCATTNCTRQCPSLQAVPSPVLKDRAGGSKWGRRLLGSPGPAGPQNCRAQRGAEGSGQHQACIVRDGSGVGMVELERPLGVKD